jgi:hypothetical protein
MTLIIIGIFIFILFIGFWTIYKRLSNYIQKHDFAFEYRNNFIEFSNLFHSSQGTFNNEKYIWLTKNVGKIQRYLGNTGKMEYLGAFQRIHISNYEIVINTLPKFRDGNIHPFDINSTDDCLIRYIGLMEEQIIYLKKIIKNPIILFKEGFQEIFSLPIYILNWFGILTDNSVYRVTTNIIYKLVLGLGGLVSFLSAVVTIIQGKEETLKLFQKIFSHL